MEICSYKQILDSSFKHILEIKMFCRDDADRIDNAGMACLLVPIRLLLKVRSQGNKGNCYNCDVAIYPGPGDDAVLQLTGFLGYDDEEIFPLLILCPVHPRRIEMDYQFGHLGNIRADVFPSFSALHYSLIDITTKSAIPAIIRIITEGN